MSSKKLREFISQVKKGGMALGSHYFVELNLPKCLQGNEPIASNIKKIALFCDSTEVPGINLDSNEIRTYGEKRESVYGKSYDAFAMSFYLDNDFVVKQLFDSWVDKIYDPVTRHLNYPSEYTTDKINIFIQDKEDNDRYVVTLHEAYVKTVGPIPLSYDSKDVLRLKVTFNYKYASYERYGYTRTPTGNIITRINSTVQNVLQNGISGAISGISNFDYGFNAIPKDYFTSFSAFQSNYSRRSTNLNEISTPNDLSGTEYI